MDSILFFLTLAAVVLVSVRAVIEETNRVRGKNDKASTIPQPAKPPAPMEPPTTDR